MNAQGGDEDVTENPQTMARVIDLVADSCRFELPLLERRRGLMTGISGLLDADYWVWSQMSVDPETGEHTPIDLVHNFPEAILGLLMAGINDPVNPCPAASKLFTMLDVDAHQTRGRWDLVTDRRWYGSEHYERYRKPCGIDDCVYSFYTHKTLIDGVDRALISGVVLHRKTGRQFFSEQQVLLLHTVLSRLHWLHQPASMERDQAVASGLTTRQREVVGYMAEGKTVQQIAVVMGVSVNTVNTHLKAVYRAFGVNNRSMMMARLLSGNKG